MSLWICLSLLTQFVLSSNYYISSSSGSDSNSGTSIQSPWKSFNHVPSLKLSGGDNLLLFAGDTWKEQLIINNASSQNGQLITIGMYQTNTIATRPHIDLSNTAYEFNAAITCIDCETITFNSLEISGAAYGIKLSWTNNKIIFNHYNISNCYFHHINGNYSTANNNWWGAAINVQGTVGGIKLENFIMEHNMVNASDTFFNMKSLQSNTKAPTILSGHMKSTLLTHNYYNVMFMINMYNFKVYDNVFMKDTPIQQFSAGTTDIIVGNLDSTCSIVNNEFISRGEFPGGPDGCSIDFETAANGVSVIDNYIVDSYGAGIMVYGHPSQGKLNSNLTINNNVFVRDGCIQIHADHGAIAFMYPASGKIENNFFVKCSNSSVPIFFDRSGNGTFLENWIFVNNTIQNNTNGYVVDNPIVAIEINQQQHIAEITAKCGGDTSDCLLKYTLDGTKPNLQSTEYKTDEIIKVYVVTPVLFKAFKNGLIQSSTVGQIVNPL